MEWQVDITSRSILTIPESNWCHGWYVTWLFRYIGYRFIVALNDMFFIKVADIIDDQIFFLPRYASSLSLYKIPDRYYLNFYLSMKKCKLNVFFASAFFLFHIKSCRDPLYKRIVSSWILENNCFWYDSVVCSKLF